MGEGEIDGRSDLYSLAVVGYQMLAGELPFKASNTPAMLMKHLSDPLRPLRSVQPDVPRQLAALIERTLAKKPHQRWRDAAEFRDALDAVSVSDAPESGPPAVHASAAWKRPAVAPQPAPPRAAQHRDDPQVRLPRLSNLSAPDYRNEGGASKRDRSLARRSPARAPDDGHSDRPPVPSFMPESWHDARNAWGRPEERGGKRSRASRIRDFRQHLARTGVMVATLGTVNLMFSPGFLWFLFPTAFFGLGMLRRAGSLWADGIRIRDVLGRQASEELARGEVAEPYRGSRPPSVNELARQLAPADVLAGPYGDSIRRAASDRAGAREALAKLAPPDLEMIPDVAPTLDALAERVSSLAQALHGLERAAPADAMASVEAALAEARTRHESAERDRRVEMLERQRDTIADLAKRREGLKEQLENATLLLQSMRLDLLALGSAGVQSAINDATSATQEARALSRDLRIALDAAKQIRTGA